MKILFAGPSLHRELPFLCKHSKEIVCRGPARCGDIALAVRQGAQAIALIDGVFAESAAPWHKEILLALEQGIPIAGGASMGALRAAECRTFGMIGIGRIFEHYATDEVTDDSDVAQLHAPSELNYLPLTEPWVNMAPTFRALRASGMLPNHIVDDLDRLARGLHYTDRTYSHIVRRCQHLSNDQRTQVLTWLEKNAIDQKRLDALACVDWLLAQPAGPSVEKHAWTLSMTAHFLKLLAATQAQETAR